VELRAVEGRVKHIEMVKRQMFGGACLSLLRKRVLSSRQDPGQSPCHVAG
jgi:hypothetical protein